MRKQTLLRNGDSYIDNLKSLNNFNSPLSQYRKAGIVKRNHFLNYEGITGSKKDKVNIHRAILGHIKMKDKRDKERKPWESE